MNDITVNDIANAIQSQHDIILDSSTFDQMYIHRCRAYGTAGGYLSMAPYCHRFNYVPDASSLTGLAQTWNTYESSLSTAGIYRRGNLQQMYEFGINGSTRPSLHFDWPKDEILNNPFIVGNMKVDNQVGSGTVGVGFVNNCKMLTIQSTNTNGNALYIIQFDVTVRNSNFVEIAPALGAAAFGENNVITDNYKSPNEVELKEQEGRKAEELANKKRKIENVKALTMPALDAH